MIRFLALCPCLLVLGACAVGETPYPPASAAVSAGTEDAVARAGDVTMHASVMQTSALNEGVARDYGIPRSDNTVLLLVAVRKGEQASDVAMPARIDALVTDLSGRRQAITMRELRTPSAGADRQAPLLDYVGSVEIAPPDTLRFDVNIVGAGGQASRLQFDREFFAR